MSTSIEEPPPSYATANAGTGPQDRRQPARQTTLEGEEDLPLTEEGRRSMEDEARPLPEGWIRQFDAASGHHFYVDTKANPPRSIWEHPFDREDVWQHPDDNAAAQRKVASSSAATRPTVQSQQSSSGKPSLGVRIKDKLTGTTHEQREDERRKRYQQQLAAEKAYMERRKALMEQMRAQQAAYPQQYQQYGYGSSPMMYGRPAYGYQPTYRRGYGGGMGPMGYGAMGLGGGLLGGMMLGSAMDGGFDGGDYGGGGGDFGGGDFGGGGGDGGGGF